MFILSALHQAPLYNRFNPDKIYLSDALTPGSAVNGGARSLLDDMRRPLSVFRCPTDTGPDTNSVSNRLLAQNDGSDAEPVATSNYIGNNGSGITDATPRRALEPGRRCNGLFRNHKTFAMKDITDGASNTLLVGERSYVLPSPSGGPIECAAGTWLATEMTTMANTGGDQWRCPVTGAGGSTRRSPRLVSGDSQAFTQEECTSLSPMAPSDLYPRRFR